VRYAGNKKTKKLAVQGIAVDARSHVCVVGIFNGGSHNLREEIQPGQQRGEEEKIITGSAGALGALFYIYAVRWVEYYRPEKASTG